MRTVCGVGDGANDDADGDECDWQRARECRCMRRVSDDAAHGTSECGGMPVLDSGM